MRRVWRCGVRGKYLSPKFWLVECGGWGGDGGWEPIYEPEAVRPTLPLADPVTRAGPATFLVHTTMRQCSKKIKIKIEGTVEYVHSILRSSKRCSVTRFSTFSFFNPIWPSYSRKERILAGLVQASVSFQPYWMAITVECALCILYEKHFIIKEQKGNIKDNH